MEPVTPAMMIVTALATGAATGAAEQLVKDAYTGLKSLLTRRFKIVSLEALEQKPSSKAKQSSVAEDLTDVGADRDEEVLKNAQELIKLIDSRSPSSAAAAGITIDQLRAGSSINIKDLTAPGDISISGLTAGVYKAQEPLGENPHPNL